MVAVRRYDHDVRIHFICVTADRGPWVTGQCVGSHAVGFVIGEIAFERFLTIEPSFFVRHDGGANDLGFKRRNDVDDINAFTPIHKLFGR